MVKKLFPTLIYEGQLSKTLVKKLNQELIKEILHYEQEDEAGLKWSQKNYRGGYTSYNSLAQMHTISPTFAKLEKYLDQQVKKYIHGLNWNLHGRKIKMTTCWMNVMPQNTYHPLHIHPLSAISGTYYVQVPKSSSSLKIEDTKMQFLMSTPPRKKDDYYYHFKPNPGSLILFESWVRHEVPPNPAKQKRISVSFNYEWL